MLSTMTIYCLFFLFYLTMMLRSVNGYTAPVELSPSGDESLCKYFHNIYTNKPLECDQSKKVKMICTYKNEELTYSYCRRGVNDECYEPYNNCSTRLTCSEDHICKGSATLTKRIPYYTQHYMCALMQADEDKENCKIFGRKLNACGIMRCLKGPLDTCGTHMYSSLGECAAGLQCIDGVCQWPQRQLTSWNTQPRFKDKIRKSSVSKNNYYHTATMLEKQNGLIRNTINEIFPSNSDKAAEYYYD